MAVRWELSTEQYLDFRARGMRALPQETVRVLNVLPQALGEKVFHVVAVQFQRPHQDIRQVAAMKEAAQIRLILDETRLLVAADQVIERFFSGGVLEGDRTIEAYWSSMREHPSRHQRYEEEMLRDMSRLTEDYCREVMAARQREFNALGLLGQVNRAQIIHKYALSYHVGLANRFKEFCLREAATAGRSIVSLYWYRKMVLYGSLLMKIHSQGVMKEMAKEHRVQREHWSRLFFVQGERSLQLDESHVVQEYEKLAEAQALGDTFTEELYKEDLEKLEAGLVKFRTQLANWESLSDREYGNPLEIQRAIPSFTRAERALYETSFGYRQPPLPREANIEYFFNQMKALVVLRLHSFVEMRAAAKG